VDGEPMQRPGASSIVKMLGDIDNQKDIIEWKRFLNSKMPVSPHVIISIISFDSSTKEPKLPFPAVYGVTYSVS
jgi:hypothetical protein